jgi:hypothetical protein
MRTISRKNISSHMSAPRPHLMQMSVDLLMPDATAAKPQRTARRHPPRRAVRAAPTRRRTH